MRDNPPLSIPSSSTHGLRMPSSLREQLHRLASAARRSLNAEIVDRLTRSLGSRGSEATAAALAHLQLPEIVRMAPVSPSNHAVTVLLELTDSLGVESLLLAARRDELNHASLTVVLETPSFSILADDLGLNMAREPRIANISDLFRAWDERGLLRRARVATELSSPTVGLPPAEAHALLARESKIRRIAGSIKPLLEFLTLLAGHEVFDPVQFLKAPAPEDDQAAALP